jgi:hypothetical protein
MIYIVFQKDQISGHVKNGSLRHLGLQLEKRQWLAIDTQPVAVTSVYADGDELEFLRRNFTNIPFASTRTQIWRGDFAAFIADNLP